MITLVSYSSLATSAPTPPSAFVDPSAIQNTHKAKDAVFRECKAQADAQQLTGDARDAFIATCVKNN